MFAQLSTSVSDGQIRLIILALLGIAVALAMLTVWYAVKTSPRRRVQAAQARRQPGSGSRPAQRQPGGQAAAGPAGGAARSAPSATAPSAAAPGPTRPQPVEIVDEDDEWTRLTSPQQQRSPNA